MTRKTMRVIGILLTIAAATAVLTLGIGWASASETADTAPTTAAQVGTAFTYQGSLEDGSGPVNETCDMEFSLYDAASGGAQAGSTVTASNVTVSGGLFAVELDFGSQFTGSARYLQISVRCPAGSGSYTSLNGRVALNPAPYAMYAAGSPWSGLSGVPADFADGTDDNATYTAGPGLTLSAGEFSVTTAYQLPQGCANGQIAEWNGSAWDCGNDDAGSGGDITGVTAGTGLTGGGLSGDVTLNADFAGSGAANTISRSDHDHFGDIWTGSSPLAGLQIENSAITGTFEAILGIASDSGSASSYGVYGQSNSSAGIGVGGSAPNIGVKGSASNTSGLTAGVYGQNYSPSGAGISGWSSASSSGSAVYGNNVASAGMPYGVYGVASDTGSASSYGVYGLSNSSAGVGVGGDAKRTGVIGVATDTSGTTWGVYGLSYSPSGYGVYSEGAAHVEGQLTWKPITGSISLSAAAFNPRSNTYIFTNDGHTLTPGDTSSNNYLATVQLPQGATITNFTFYWTDSSNLDGDASLYRIDLAGSESGMAIAATSGGGGGSTVTSSSSDGTIPTATVDNSQYAYYVWVYLPMDGNGDPIEAHGVVIEYTIDRPY